MRTYVLIPAAGSGRRFGAAKQFLSLAGRPVLTHCLEVFQKSQFIDGFCVIVPPADVATTREIVGPFSKMIDVVAGGKERQDSVRLGFERLPPCDLVMIHDGVRPFITERMIQESIPVAQEVGGCIVGIPVSHTTKKVDSEGFILETIDRSTLWNIQTPQTFRSDLFKKALQKSREDSFLGTDEAMLVERIGGKIKVILGSATNLKITTPEDLKIAEALWKAEHS